MSRTLLPARRPSLTSTFLWMHQHRITVTLGFYGDGTLAEVFATAGKSGEQLEAAARDAMIITSLALQHGVKLDTILGALTREENGTAASLAGAILDHVAEETRHE